MRRPHPLPGDEIGELVIERFYPELIRASLPSLSLISAPFDHPEPGDFLRPPFDFRAEMHETRITADALLAEGKIEEAEAYMECAPHCLFETWIFNSQTQPGLFCILRSLRRFPGGAAGEDPVGPAVRALREQSDSLADFVNTISWMTNFEQLQEAVNP